MKTTTWKPAQARDLRHGARVRITYAYSDGSKGEPFEGYVSRKGRGWDATIQLDGGGRFAVSRHYSDWGTYTIEVEA